MIGANDPMQDKQTSRQHDSSRSRSAQRLREVSRSLISTDAEQLPAKVITTAAELTDSERATFLLLDPATGRLRYVPAAESSADDQPEIPVEGSAAGWVIRHGQPLTLDSGATDLEEFIDTRGDGVRPLRNLASVPLFTRGRAIGVLEVGNKREADGYSQEDIELLQLLALFAALAIDNSQLLQQTDLIAEFMHEVKTPLMALTAASELLARDIPDEKESELIHMIERETFRLSKMAQDFLDLTRLESGRAQIVRRPVDLAEVITDVVRLQEPQAAIRDITVSVDTQEDLPVILGDYDRLRQVFLNLTSNAIKYNEENGQVKITVCQQREDALVEITDTGPGIAEENLPHLFERFYRIPDREGFTKGTGLGLSIAARILHEHGGRIDVESELGQGSTFRCYLPLQS